MKKSFKTISVFENAANNLKRLVSKGQSNDRGQTTKEYTFEKLRKRIMFPVTQIFALEDKNYLEEKNYQNTFPIVYNSTMIPIDSLEAMAKDTNPKYMPTSEEADTWIEGNEVLYIYPGLEEPIRYPKDMYIKYFWLFYIVAKDFWDKYPQHVYFSQGSYTNKRDKDSRQRLEDFRERFGNAIEEAIRNLPWAKEANKMVEEKKEEGTFWSELADVAKECDKLEGEAN